MSNLVFLDNIPKKNNKYNWKESIGIKVKFIYKGINGELDILEYISEKQSLQVLCNNEKKYITTESLTHCRLSIIVGKISKEFRYNINDNFRDDKRNLIIIDRFKIKDSSGRNRKMYKCVCLICGYDEWVIEENNLKKGNSCPCCNNIIIKRGINDIATTNPEMVKFFLDKEEAYKFCCKSNKKVRLICPICKNKTEMYIYNLYKRGFSCKVCSDGISFPNKFMISFFRQLLENNFIKDFSTEVQFESIPNKRYDIMAILNNGEILICENNGLQHYDDKCKLYFKQRFEDIKKNDIYKKELLKEKESISYYIQLDCKKSTLEYIKKSIESSELNKIFDLKIINWDRCLLESSSNLLKEVCKLRSKSNNGLGSKEIAKKFMISSATVVRYLNIGNTLGLCRYNGKEEVTKNLDNKRDIISNKNKKKVEVFRDGKLLGCFDSAKDLYEKSLKLFNVELKSEGIRMVCNGKRKSYKGYIFKYIV